MPILYIAIFFAVSLPSMSFATTTSIAPGNRVFECYVYTFNALLEVAINYDKTDADIGIRRLNGLNNMAKMSVDRCDSFIPPSELKDRKLGLQYFESVLNDEFGEIAKFNLIE